MFVPGKHDEVLREYAGSNFGDIRVVREAVHTAADGRRYLLMHGDEFDQIRGLVWRVCGSPVAGWHGRGEICERRRA